VGKQDFLFHLIFILYKILGQTVGPFLVHKCIKIIS